MSNSQNQSAGREVIVTREKKENVNDDSSPPAANYYYDDSTGYEIYDDQSEVEEQDNSMEDVDS